MRRSLLAVVLACGSASIQARETQDIRASDRSVFLPSAALTFDLPQLEHRSADRVAFEAQFAGGRGSAGQHLEGGSPIRFGGQVFGGPQDLRHDFAFQYTEVGVRGFNSWRRFPSLGYEIGAGLAFASLELRTSGVTQTARESLDGIFFAANFGVSWTFLPSTRLSARGSILEGSRKPADVITDGGRAELQLAWTPVRHATLRAGYSWWSLRSGREANDKGMAKSPIHIEMRGPSLGLEIAF